MLEYCLACESYIVVSRRETVTEVIVERATEARENDHSQKMKEKEKRQDKNMRTLAAYCAGMDADNSRSISLEEVLEGYHCIPEF